MRILIALLSIMSLGIAGVISSSFKINKKIPGVLRVSNNGRFLVQSDGKPFFWLGDTGWNLFSRLNREEARKYLEDRHKKRFNVIQTHLLGWTLADSNAYGHLPFMDNDFNKPNELYWKHVDFIISAADEIGLYMALVPDECHLFTTLEI